MKFIDFKTSPDLGKNRGSAKDPKLITIDPASQSTVSGGVGEAGLAGMKNRAAFPKGLAKMRVLPPEMPDSMGSA